MIDYNKSEIKESLSVDDIFSLLQEWGADPEMTDFGIIATTICHNNAGEGSKKLYFYENSNLFRCYTGCDATFDIFELTIKVMNIQNHQEWGLNDAVRFIARRFGIAGTEIDNEDEKLDDWTFINNYNRIQDISPKDFNVVLKEYDISILKRFNYNVKIGPWLKEDISQEVLDYAFIGFYPGGDQITIPHFDINGRFIGLRGRTLCLEEAEKYGKYRPLRINNLLYSHPLGMNLYGLNWAKNNIKKFKKVIIFESEKSVLKYMSIFGIENNIAVACCGSSISIFQIQFLIECGAEEIIIAFDRQFQLIGDKEFKHLTSNLLKLKEKYERYAIISFLFDKKMITGYKASPIDEGREKFLQLYNERILI